MAVKLSKSDMSSLPEWPAIHWEVLSEGLIGATKHMNRPFALRTKSDSPAHRAMIECMLQMAINECLAPTAQ